jgi:hypothetical protein
VPFVRVSRDKRGYQQVYLMDTSMRRGRPPKPLLIYWYRTPPGIRVGRDPFDPATRRALESQNPGVVFDWDKLSVLPAAPVEGESWRERRLAERAARRMRRHETQADEEPNGDTTEAVETAEVPAEPATPTSEGRGPVSMPAESFRRRRRRRGHRHSPAGGAETTANPAPVVSEPEPSEPS